jgi:hypothetical protein
MLPKERRDNGQNDLFKSRLDQIVDMNYALAKLARQIDWGFLAGKFGAVYADVPGRPPLPTQLMAGLAILKHTFNLSDEALCERWVENPYYQLVCGEAFFRHDVPFDRASMTRWRQSICKNRYRGSMRSVVCHSQEFVPCACVVPEAAEHTARDHFRSYFVNASAGNAMMRSLDLNSYALWLQYFLYG